MVEDVHEGTVALDIQPEQPLVEQHVDGLQPGTLDHELGTRLAEDRSRVVDQPARAGLDAQIDAAPRVGRRRPLRDRRGRSAIVAGR